MATRYNYLFADGDLGDTLRSIAKNVTSLVNAIPQDQFLISTDDQLLEHVLGQVQVEPLVLLEDHAEMAQSEADIDVTGDGDRYWSDDTGHRTIRGTRLTVTIPFTGDHTLWSLKPSRWRASFPWGDIEPPHGDHPGMVTLTIAKGHDAVQEAFKQAYNGLIEDIRFYIEGQKINIDAHNNALPSAIQNAITARRTRIEQHEGLASVLNIPVKRRDGAPPIKPVRVEKKLTKPLPAPSRSGFKPEPGITDDLYEEILTIIRHEGRTFETTPTTYAVHGEEQLRDIILAHLNGHYKGGATGETFRKHGKTDIRIEDEERAAFVAECKLWRGQKELSEAIEQLLGYLTWRDCKTALVVFNKDVAGFASLLEKVPQALRGHNLMVKDLGTQSDGEWRYIFHAAEDEQRHIALHVFLFNLYVAA